MPTPRRWWPLVTDVCVALFVVLYIVAAWLYPGGTRVDPAHNGFSLAQSYTCDLFEARGYGGRSNPGRPVALAAAAVLAFGLAVLWWRVPSLTPEARRRRHVVRAAGVASGVFAPLVATSLHDLVINGAGLLAVVAFATTMSAYGRRAGPGLVALAALACAFAGLTFFIWKSRVGVLYLPGVQKVFVLLFLGWVLAMSRRLRQVSAAGT
jgi:hypothetical protein